MARDVLVAVGIPSMETWHAQFGMAVAAMVADFCTAPITGIRHQALKVFNKRGSLLPQMRQELVEQALEIGATHVFFVDCDQAFPPCALRQMLMDAKPVVACNTVIKTFPSAPTARNFQAGNPHGKCVFSTPQKRQLEQVWRVGTGCMLIDTAVFAKMPKPWFLLRYIEEDKKYLGEDWYFCEQLEKIGLRPWIDHKISLELEHYGSVGFDHSMVPMQQLEEAGLVSLEGECTPLAEVPVYEDWQVVI